MASSEAPLPDVRLGDQTGRFGFPRFSLCKQQAHGMIDNAAVAVAAIQADLVVDTPEGVSGTLRAGGMAEVT